LSTISLLHVNEAEHKSKQHTHATDSDVADGKEVVLPTKGIGSTQNEALGSLELINLIIVVNLDLIFPWFKSTFNLAP